MSAAPGEWSTALKRTLRPVRFWFGALGFDPLRTWYGVLGTPALLRDYFRFRSLLGRRKEWPVALSAPCVADRWMPSGEIRGHYFQQDLFVARKVHERNPRAHLDVGSRIDGFVAHVASFREITVLDIRPQTLQVPNIRFVQQDVTRLPPSMHGVADSLSCLHALEHFGLGRYGDPVAALGYVEGFRSLSRLLAADGILYLSVPIGRQRVEFNGHRVFAISTILDLAAEEFELSAFSYVDDSGVLHEDVAVSRAEAEFSFGLEYGCGIFELHKKK